jgi:hypothetical protein
MSRAVPTLLIDNERVRVTEWRFAPGAATGWHRHAMDYVVLPMTDGALELVGPDDVRTRAELKKGAPYFPQRRGRARRDQRQRLRVRLRRDRAEVASAAI